MFFEDIVYAAKKFDANASETSEEPILKAARHIHELCKKLGLTIIVLQPFLNYDGVLDENRHQELLVKCALLIKIAHTLRTDMIQIPSQVSLIKFVGDA